MANSTSTDFFAFNAAKDKLLAVANAFEDATKRFVNADNSQFFAYLDTFKQNISSIVLNNTIGESLKSLFTAFEIVGANARDQFYLSVQLFDFGDNDTEILFNQKQSKNNIIINNAIQINALCIAYNASAQIDYTSEQDLETISNILNNQYQKVIDNEINSTIRISLLNLRTIANSFFQELDLKSIVTIKTKQIPSTVLSYQYYKDSSNANQIISLNSIQNTGFIQGESIKIVST